MFRFFIQIDSRTLICTYKNFDELKKFISVRSFFLSLFLPYFLRSFLSFLLSLSIRVLVLSDYRLRYDTYCFRFQSHQAFHSRAQPMNRNLRSVRFRSLCLFINGTTSTSIKVGCSKRARFYDSRKFNFIEIQVDESSLIYRRRSALSNLLCLDGSLKDRFR